MTTKEKKQAHAERLAFYLNDLIEQIEQFPIRTAINMSHAKDAIKQYDKRKGE